MRQHPDLIPSAILLSDIHLSLKPPVARSAERNWMACQAFYLKQVRELAEDLQVPVVVAGDLFHQWDSKAELINFAIDNLPLVYAVCGQHDLAHHRMEDVGRTSFWTLVEAGKVKHLQYQSPRRLGKLVLYGFGWNEELKPRQPLETDRKDDFYLAVVHRYCWKAGHSFPGAKEENHVKYFHKQLKGFHGVVVGDNHISHLTKFSDGVHILNCGGLMRRRIDERDYQPCVGVLYSNGVMERIPLYCEEDKFIALDDLTPDNYDASDFLEELATLGDSGLDFVASLNRAIREPTIKPQTRDFIITILEKLGT